MFINSDFFLFLYLCVILLGLVQYHRLTVRRTDVWTALQQLPTKNTRVEPWFSGYGSIIWLTMVSHTVEPYPNKKPSCR